MITIKSHKEIELMRHAGSIVAGAHALVGKLIRPGITTLELDRAVEKFIKDADAIPTFKGYGGFPKSICASVNEEVVHGIPGKRKLLEGDIISIDIGATYKGYVGDAAMTHGVGNISEEAQRLIDVTRESFFKGIVYAREGYRLSDISNAVQTYVEENGFSVVRDYVGHGVGKKMHEDPPIPNYGLEGHGPRLRQGMTLAIEPMVNVGTYDVVVLDNDWTVVTTDGKLSSHFEHTILITGTAEPELLTVI
ncbi:type I methionyl aminopeptidase [Acetobacterium paludosum]|uniref:Methionine aminopeptidase n=1 Tax=Acetobacterium paludosum TaxID=52693 RepID=A0A923I2C4_9FIRM|nr:type I methionyl aminopeptidase [Acetobacterium paludosum]MBC3888733.1 type I methionyl aminopeptidase [Acetobacterium paludosum]